MMLAILHRRTEDRAKENIWLWMKIIGAETKLQKTNTIVQFTQRLIIAQTKEHGVVGYATSDKFRKKIDLTGKDHAIGGACLIDLKGTGCVDMDFFSLAVRKFLSTVLEHLPP
jgi:hypothetical protein